MPPPPDRLVFVHLSDLHLGDALLPPPPASSRAPRRRVRLPHNPDLLFPLRLALHDVAAETGVPEPDIALLASGDLTNNGSPRQMAAARDLLTTDGPPNPMLARIKGLPAVAASLGAGVGLRRARIAAVPGNHDHWAGGTFWQSVAYDLRAFSAHFTPPVLTTTFASSAGGFALDLIGVDSNSGFRPHQPDAASPSPATVAPHRRAERLSNRRARGRLDGPERTALSAHLRASQAQPQPPLRLRAIVNHHALRPCWDEPLLGVMDPLDTQLLLQAAHAGDSPVILTGHTHLIDLHRFSPRTIWELRAPSPFKGPLRSTDLGFWVHHLELRSTRRLVWTAWPYFWDGASRFASAADPRLPRRGPWFTTTRRGTATTSAPHTRVGGAPPANA
ncbi:MAG: metallophosphoesterase [Planctomycetaceae bacterium]|nr:metallophosphoesterase [Phycisphaerales bacterium]MCE2654741.1 metallophosphoesterase [Planctomycetaceae bacterium]